MPSSETRRSLARWATGAYLVAWGAALVAPPVALLRWREARLAALAAPAAQADWDTFRQDMRRQSGQAGPVQRKVPRSPEPPERVWLRDHVGLAVTAWVVLMGALGGFLALVVRGMLRPTPDSTRPPPTTPNETSTT